STVPRFEPGEDEGDFTHAYRHGNDMTLYLVGRQAARRGVSVARVWDGVYSPDFGDDELPENRRQMRAAALWNLLDPSLAAAMTGYVRQHMLRGEARVRSEERRV